MKIKDLCNYLESICPLAYQESYDNCGLLLGSDQTEISKVLITLDCTEDVIDEAIREGCNLVIAHHPLIFGGIKKITGKNEVQRTIIKALKNEIAVYAIHTNLDNIKAGVNKKIAEKLGLNQIQILEPKSGYLRKLITYVPNEHLENVLNALFNAGAGNIGNYAECSFVSTGTGTFKGNSEAQPFVGENHQRHKEAESKIEVVYPSVRQLDVLQALFTAHPYEVVAYDVFELQNAFSDLGAGMLGILPVEMEEQEFLAFLKERMELEMIRFTSFKSQKISKIAICGGAGSFLLNQAIQSGAQAFVSADFKYHEFFGAEKRLLIADIGHYESEKFTKSLIGELILEKFPNFAILLSKTETNPVNYYK